MMRTMRRTLGIAAGVLTQVLFVATVWRLAPFLWEIPPSNAGSLWIDLLLAAQFNVVHSFLLYPAVRDRVERIVPTAFYSCFFCVVTCLGLLLLMSCWRSNPMVLWQFTRAGRVGMAIACGVAWMGLFYSLYLAGLGYQTGLKPWWYWVRGRKPPRRSFQPRGAFRLLRHPVYASFLALIWCTPTVTLDRGLLIAICTGYVYVGSCLKDRRLLFYMGAAYRQYQARVPGYPGMPFGPLARVVWQEERAELPVASANASLAVSQPEPAAAVL